MKYAWIESKTDCFEVVEMYKLLNITRSNYYHWLNTDTSEKERLKQSDVDLVKAAFKNLKRNTGSRSIKGYLKHSTNIIMSRRKIRKIMLEQGLQVQTQKKFKNRNVSHIKDPKIQPNKLNRNFSVSYPNQVWVFGYHLHQNLSRLDVSCRLYRFLFKKGCWLGI